MDKKRCGRCKEYKDKFLFSKDKSRRDGHKYECKKCATEYRKSHLPYFREYGRKYQLTHPRKFIYKKRLLQEFSLGFILGFLIGVQENG